MRVLVWGSGYVMGVGVKSILASESDLEVKGVDSGSESQLLEAIACYQPHVVILAEYNPRGAAIQLSSLIMHHPEIRWITVSSEDNWLHLYHKMDFFITNISDLVEVIHTP